MRRLVPATGGMLTDVDLVQAYDWPAERWVRACFARTLDGAITGPDGLSRSISSPADRRVMAAIRRLADVYLAGAGTVRAEGYTAVRAEPDRARERVAQGLAPSPTLAVVTTTCDFDWEHVEFINSETRPIMLTTASSDAAARSAAERWCEVVVAGEQQVEPRRALDALAERGLNRVSFEGGDQLLAGMVHADALDEMDLTVAPVLTGAPHGQRTGEAVLSGMRLHQLLEDDGYLFARYLRRQ